MTEVSFDNTPNATEGWAIFQTTGTDDIGDWRLERNDEEEKFDSDLQAWEFVLKKALWDLSEHHQKAIAFLARHNSDEYERIEGHAAYLGWIAPGVILMDRFKQLKELANV